MEGIENGTAFTVIFFQKDNLLAAPNSPVAMSACQDNRGFRSTAVGSSLVGAPWPAGRRAHLLDL